jgi:hypothetical protein
VQEHQNNGKYLHPLPAVVSGWLLRACHMWQRLVFSCRSLNKLVSLHKVTSAVFAPGSQHCVHILVHSIPSRGPHRHVCHQQDHPRGPDQSPCPRAWPRWHPRKLRRPRLEASLAIVLSALYVCISQHLSIPTPGKGHRLGRPFFLEAQPGALQSPEVPYDRNRTSLRDS